MPEPKADLIQREIRAGALLRVVRVLRSQVMGRQSQRCSPGDPGHTAAAPTTPPARCLRHCPGGTPTAFLNARLNAASDS
jgi:hypothetical protein